MKCVHHWILPPPDGRPYIEATCTECGDRKQMRASPIVYDGRTDIGLASREAKVAYAAARRDLVARYWDALRTT